MSKKTEKPYVLRAAEYVYSNIVKIKSSNPEANNIQAFEIFMTSEEYDLLSSGKLLETISKFLVHVSYVDPSAPIPHSYM